MTLAWETLKKLSQKAKEQELGQTMVTRQK